MTKKLSTSSLTAKYPENNYMHEGLNSLKPYSYRESRFNGEVSYQFTTTTGIEYNCYFLDASGYFESYPDIGQSVVTFGFHIAQTPSFFKQQYDIRIRDTIFDILYKSALTFPERSILVIYDTRDLRPRHRKVIFSKWFNEFCEISGLHVTKMTLSIPSEEASATLFVCIFVPPDSPNIWAIRAAFIDIRDELISKGHPPTTTEFDCS